MSGLWIVLVAAGLLMASGIPACFGPRRSVAGQRLTCAMMVLGGVVGWCGVVAALRAEAPPFLSLAWGLPWGSFSVGLDPLSAVFLVSIFTVPVLGSVCGLGYWRQTEHPENGRGLGLFYGLLAGSLVLVVLARDAVLFMIAWEAMALSAFFLVSTEHENPEVRRAGWIYLIATHTGTICLLALFASMHAVSGSFAFLALDPSSVSTAGKAALFLLTLVGFGFKAGIVPMHVWLPGAHANAPSHVSAVMSGVMLKMGIYGILRMLMLLPDTGLWSGALLLVLGAVGGILGIVSALGQSDIKRLLAYSSIENIGIIVMGIGLAVMGRALHEGGLVLLGLGGALMHVWNHGLFKSLLFMNSGAIIHAVHSRDLNRMGGLARGMPCTAAFFLVGALAICGLPPLNGFIGEWLLYLGLFRGMGTWQGVAGFSAAFGAVALALIGALALACFVKAYAMVFLGVPRHPLAAEAHEPRLSMRIPMALLAGGCVAIGLFPWLAMPLLVRAVAAWNAQGLLTEAEYAGAFPSLTGLSLAGLFLAGAIAAALLLVRLVRRCGAPRPITWSCGYALPSPRMQYTAASFAQMLTGLFRSVFAQRRHEPQIQSILAEPARFEVLHDEPMLDRLIMPAAWFVRRQFHRARPLQKGLTHQYLIYVVITVVVLLAWITPWKTLFINLFTP